MCGPSLSQPRAVSVFRLLTVGLILAVAGIAGGVSYRVLADGEEERVRLPPPASLRTAAALLHPSRCFRLVNAVCRPAAASVRG